MASSFTEELKPFEQIYIKDLLGQMNLEVTGSLEIVANQEIIAGAKIYSLNLKDNNLYEESSSQYFMGFSSYIENEFIYKQWITGLKENELYRSNLHITNIGNKYAYFKIELYDSEGNLLSEFVEGINPGEYKQFPQIFKYFGGKVDLENGSIRIINYSSQPIISSVSLINNKTNEAIAIPAQEEKEYY